MASRIEAQLREVARRYKRKKGRTRPQLATLRVRDLNKLFTARYGLTLPDDDAGRDDAAIMAQHLASLPGNPAERITNWLELKAPWFTIGETKALIADTITHPQRWRADKLAWRMRLTEADRRALRITTIGAIDASKGQRAKARAERNRLAKLRARRAKGAKPRAEYLAQFTKPWIAEGISRRTWFRRQRGTRPGTP